MLDFLKNILAPEEKAVPQPIVKAPPPAPEKKVVETGEALSRLQLINIMWGEGLDRPGDVKFLADLAKPLLLNSEKSVTDFSAGLGGGARLWAQQYKAYVTGFERDAELASEGMRLSTISNHVRTAPITHYDPQNITATKRADAIVFRDLLYTLSDKVAFIQKISALLKPRGHLTFTDFTCDLDFLNVPPISLWMPMEAYGCHLVPMGMIVDLLVKEGFDVRVSEDITKFYLKEALAGLGRLADFLDNKEVDTNTRLRLRRDVDLWMRKLSTLHVGVKYVRFHAIKMR